MILILKCISNHCCKVSSTLEFWLYSHNSLSVTTHILDMLKLQTSLIVGEILLEYRITDFCFYAFLACYFAKCFVFASLLDMLASPCVEWRIEHLVMAVLFGDYSDGYLIWEHWWIAILFFSFEATKHLSGFFYLFLHIYNFLILCPKMYWLGML